jgi:Domain of unknown function (DUF5753)
MGIMQLSAEVDGEQPSRKPDAAPPAVGHAVAAVARDRLNHLVEAAGLPNVTLQVLPFAAGAHAGMDGTFTILFV